jgi:hypothetical protein
MRCAGTLRRPVEQVPCRLREVQGARRRREVRGTAAAGGAGRRDGGVRSKGHASGGRCPSTPAAGDAGAPRRWEIQGHAGGVRPWGCAGGGRCKGTRSWAAVRMEEGGE